MQRLIQGLGIGLIVLLPFVMSCGSSDEAPPSGGQAAAPTAAVKALPGKSFNKFFPGSDDGLSRAFSQEKSGFAEAKLNNGGTVVASLAISDTASNPKAAAKFQNSSKKIAGYPAASSGSKGTSILVANRFQVQVRSQDDSFSETDREAWLQKFNLSGLAALSK